MSKISRKVIGLEGEKIVSSEKKYSRDVCKTCKAVLSIVFGQIGLLCILMGYLVLGAYMFRYLELDNEYNTCNSKLKIYKDKLQSSTKRVIGLGNSGLEEEEISEKISQVLITFSKDMFSLDFSPRADCEEIINTAFGSNWNFINSLLFCATIVTSVGYGQVAPKTFWGRVVCMFYSVIGIPLMLIYLSQIGQSLAKIFKFVYLNIICCRCCHDTIKRRRRQRREKLRALYEDLENHKVEEALKNGLKYDPKDAPSEYCDYDSDDEIDKLDRFDEEKDFSVPITVSIGVILVYIIIGSYIFPIWEPWTVLDSAYFCFVTVATIGFGDLVPGMGRFDKPEVILELIVCALYSLIGLSLISMCINLVQNEFINKFSWISKKFGLGVGKKTKESDSVKSLSSEESDLEDLIDMIKPNSLMIENGANMDVDDEKASLKEELAKEEKEGENVEGDKAERKSEGEEKADDLEDAS